MSTSAAGQPADQQAAPLPRPAVAEPAGWQFPSAEERVLDNGLDVIVYRLPGQKVISATLVLDVPLTVEERDKEGVATICCRCLDEGTQQHPGEGFARALERSGAGFGVDVGLSGIQLTLDVPAGRLDTALELFAEAIRTPQLADADITRHIALRLAEIEQAWANPAQAARIAFRSALFDQGSRASRMNGGGPATLGRIVPDDVRSFHAAWFEPARATMIIGGDFAGDPVEAIEAAFGSWTSTGPGNPVATVAAEPAPASLLVLDRPGAVQSAVRFGGHGVDRRDPRWPALNVAGYAMGGAFASRLNSVLREERGYTYGVGLSFMPMRIGGTFAVQGSFRTEVTADALAEARELLRIDDRPFTLDEVRDAQRHVAGSSPLSYATADRVVDQRANQVLAELPADYLDQHLARVAALEADEVSRAYAEVVGAAALSLVVVGDATRIADPLRAAGFPVEVRAPAG